MKSVIAGLVVALAAVLAFYVQTDGFTVLTTESARRAHIARQPLDIPPVRVQQANGDYRDLHELLAADGRVAIVNFMYTRCASVCVAMGLEFQALQKEIRERGLQDRVRLLSISFDPRDTPEWLVRYENRMRADTAIWQSVLAPDEAGRTQILDAFGIIVIAAPLGQFEHNTAYHVVSPEGQLQRIVDIEQGVYALYHALRSGSPSDTESAS